MSRAPGRDGSLNVTVELRSMAASQISANPPFSDPSDTNVMTAPCPSRPPTRQSVYCPRFRISKTLVRCYSENNGIAKLRLGIQAYSIYHQGIFYLLISVKTPCWVTDGNEYAEPTPQSSGTPEPRNHNTPSSGRNDFSRLRHL
jgi:hypothetical protein